MTGNIGVFIAGDLVSFYLVYALVIIPAYACSLFLTTPKRNVRRGSGAADVSLLSITLALLTEDLSGELVVPRVR